MSKITTFLTNWGIKILLVLVTCTISIAYYKAKFSRIEHGL